MEEEYPLPHPDFTPEQKAAIYAEAKKNYTVEDLIRELEDDPPTHPAEEVLAELERDIASWKTREKGAA